jgi:hypothetical protein
VGTKLAAYAKAVVVENRTGAGGQIAINYVKSRPADGSVMSEGQYRSALAQSWVEAGQKKRIGFTADVAANAPPADPVFDTFTATPEPAVPRPGQPVSLRLFPLDLIPPGLRVEVQTSLRGPWTSVPVEAEAIQKGLVSLGRFDRPCGVGWRVTGPTAKMDTEAGDDAKPVPVDGPSAATAWGYFQVRLAPDAPPPPVDVDPTDQLPATARGAANTSVDLLALVDPRRDGVAGEWTDHEVDGRRELLAPKALGARIELPYAPPEAYRLTLIVEPLDEPNGLTIGLRLGEHRFLALLGFGAAGGRVSALENIDGRNVGDNPTRIDGDVFRKNLPAEIVATVGPAGVTVTVDGRPWIDWEGKPERLSLSDYWQTPRKEALFLGAYDCRYRILRATLEPLSGQGRSLVEDGAANAR